MEISIYKREQIYFPGEKQHLTFLYADELWQIGLKKSSELISWLELALKTHFALKFDCIY